MKHQESLQLILNSDLGFTEKLQRISNFYFENVSHYNWVGFYFADDEKKELFLGPYAGADTEHTRIPFGRGICGQVAVSNENFVVPDVNAEDNYLSCSIETKAEVVLPIFKNGKNIGQIDIDSHFVDPFTQEDIAELEWLCHEIGKIMEEQDINMTE